MSTDPRVKVAEAAEALLSIARKLWKAPPEDRARFECDLGDTARSYAQLAEAADQFGTRTVEMGRVVIVKAFTDDATGGFTVTTTYSDGLSLYDALGMLTYAQFTTPETFLGDDR